MALDPNDRIDLTLAAPDGVESEGEALKTIVFRTTLGAEYPFPDMLEGHIAAIIQQLELRSETIVLRNLSSATLILPYRILSEMLVGDQTVWRK